MNVLKHYIPTTATSVREFKTIWLCPYTAKHDAKSSPFSPKPLVTKLDAGVG